MSNELPQHYGNPEFEQPQQELESRFGAKDEILNILDTGSVDVLGRIEEYYKVPAHRNIVELAHVRQEIVGGREEADLAIVQSGGREMTAVFKPLAGEATKFHNENGLGHGYSREQAAYLISEHFQFDIVPPTVVRTVGGRIGSLQHFLPYEQYRNGLDLLPTLDENAADILESSPDLAVMNVFDWITAQADRQGGNYLLRINPPSDDVSNKIEVDTSRGEIGLVAIDNGLALNDIFYRIKAKRQELPGPYQFLTKENNSANALFRELPEELLAKIAKGYQDKETLNQKLSQLNDIDPQEIEKMWQRVGMSVESKKFLSGYNAPFLNTNR